MTEHAALVLNLVSLAATVGIAYYAFVLLNLMERRLQGKARRCVSEGAVVLAGGFTVMALRMVAISTVQGNVLIFLGLYLQIIGGALILLGLRSHYRVFTPKQSSTRQ